MPSSARQQRDPRVPFEKPVWVGVHDATGPLRRLWAANLSKGGMFVKTPQPLALGENLIVALEGAEEIVPLAHARVVWQRPHRESSPAGAGLEFTQLKPSADRILQDLIEGHGGVEPALDSAAWPEPVTPSLGPPGGPRPLAAATASSSVGQARTPEQGAPALARVPEVFWTELFLPRRARVRIRMMGNTLRLDFGDGTEVQDVQHDGSAVTLHFKG